MQVQIKPTQPIEFKKRNRYSHISSKSYNNLFNDSTKNIYIRGWLKSLDCSTLVCCCVFEKNKPLNKIFRLLLSSSRTYEHFLNSLMVPPTIISLILAFDQGALILKRFMYITILLIRLIMKF